jgi:hypothetical protein
MGRNRKDKYNAKVSKRDLFNDDDEDYTQDPDDFYEKPSSSKLATTPTKKMRLAYYTEEEANKLIHAMGKQDAVKPEGS